MQYVRCLQNQGNEASLEIGRVYRVAHTTADEAESGMVRVVDNEGEDYLYPSRWFEELAASELLSGRSQPLTIHLDGASKLAVRDIANAKGLAMSALVREWIEERLDLPEAA